MEERNWRSYGPRILPEVRHQGRFRTSCYFAGIGAIEARWRLKGVTSNHRSFFQLSVQDGINGIGTESTDPQTLFNWLIEHGMVSETSCPYVGVPQVPQCSRLVHLFGHFMGLLYGLEDRVWLLDSYRKLDMETSTPEAIVDEVERNGPIMVVIPYEQFYHAVMLIGGVKNNGRVHQYVIQNSWGADWEDLGTGPLQLSDIVEAYVPILKE